MKVTKKVLAMVLAVVMLIGVLPGMAFAAEGKPVQGTEEPAGDVPEEEAGPGETNSVEEEPETKDAGPQAANFALNGAYTVKVYATVEGITFYNAEEEEVSAETSVDGEYTVYTLSADAGTYTYSADGYGTGTLKITENEDIYLRVLDFSLYSAPNTTFKIEVKAAEDNELLYSSEVTDSISDLTVQMLVPAGGWDLDYRYYCIPTL